MLIIFYYYRVSFISVKGQSLEATPEPVTGVLGGSVEITWTIKKKAEDDQILSVRLFEGKQSDNKLLYLKGAEKLEKKDYAITNFGDRLQATLEKEKVRLTLSNLNFSDVITFTLVVNLANATLDPYERLSKSVKISEVKGMQFPLKTLECVTCFDLQQDETS